MYTEIVFKQYVSDCMTYAAPPGSEVMKKITSFDRLMKNRDESLYILYG